MVHFNNIFIQMDGTHNNMFQADFQSHYAKNYTDREEAYEQQKTGEQVQHYFKRFPDIIEHPTNQMNYYCIGNSLTGQQLWIFPRFTSTPDKIEQPYVSVSDFSGNELFGGSMILPPPETMNEWMEALDKGNVLPAIQEWDEISIKMMLDQHNHTTELATNIEDLEH